MDAMDPSVLRFGTLILQACTLLKLILLLVSFLRFRSQSISILKASWSKYQKQIQNWWNKRDTGRRGPKGLKALKGRRDQELDEMRCIWTRRVWTVVFIFSMYRLILRQVGRDDTELRGASYDLNTLLMATLGLLLFSFPRLINTRSQDLWYVAAMLSLDAAFLVQLPEVDVRNVINYTFAGRFMYAVLAQRIGCVAFCVLVHLLQAIQIARAQEEPPGLQYAPSALIPMFLLMFVGIIAVRHLVRENVVLKVDLQKRTVELGAVSSLLTACYDAVVEVDQTLSLTQDSRQLSSMLLQTAPKAGGLSGKSLLDFFAEADRQRISEQVLSSVSYEEKLSVVALNADMLDSDFNHVKVELFCAQFKNLVNERCFLVALREIQDLEPLEPSEALEPLESATAVTPVSPVLPHSNPSPTNEGNQGDQQGNQRHEDLMVVYDVYTFEVLVMSPAMKLFCQPYLGDSLDTILDLASHDSRARLSQQLQHLGNSFAASDASRQPKDSKDPIDPKDNSTASVSVVTFDLLGLCEVKAFVSIEQDHFLRSDVGSMVIHLEPHQREHANLTESNLQTLQSLTHHPRQAVGQVENRRRGSSRSSRSRGSRASRGSRRSGRSVGLGSPRNSAGGAISDLHSDGCPSLQEIITKLPL